MKVEKDPTRFRLNACYLGILEMTAELQYRTDHNDSIFCRVTAEWRKDERFFQRREVRYVDGLDAAQDWISSTFASMVSVSVMDAGFPPYSQKRAEPYFDALPKFLPEALVMSAALLSNGSEVPGLLHHVVTSAAAYSEACADLDTESPEEVFKAAAAGAVLAAALEEALEMTKVGAVLGTDWLENEGWRDGDEDAE